jgi:hypothetical protein
MRTALLTRLSARVVAALVCGVLIADVAVAVTHSDPRSSEVRSDAAAKGTTARGSAAPRSATTTVPGATPDNAGAPAEAASEADGGSPSTDPSPSDDLGEAVSSDPPPSEDTAYPVYPWTPPDGAPAAPPSDHVTTTLPCPTLTREAPAIVDRPGLYLLRTDGSLERFFDDISVGSISPDGRMIVFGTRNGGLCVADIAAGPARRLADQYVSFNGAHTGIVEWAPDGHAVLATLEFSTGSQPVALPINGPPGPLIERPGSPPVAWSPDSTRLCAVTGQSLILMNPDGTNRQEIYSSQGDNSGFATLQWLDGTIYAGSGFGSLMRIGSDGSNPTPINATGMDFDWRSDGWAALLNRTTLSMRSPSGDVFEVGTRIFHARWIFDGRIAYWTRLAVSDEVRVMSLDGSGVQTLLSAPGGNTNLHIAHTAPALHADLIAVTISLQASMLRSG